MAERLLLVRHGRVGTAYRGRLIGATDVPLDSTGLVELRPLANRVRRWRHGKPCGSDLESCRSDLQSCRSDLQSDLEKVCGLARDRLPPRWSDYKSDLQCYSSPMERCRQTAAVVVPDTQLEYDSNLREIDFGRWEGHTFAEVASADPATVDRWAAFEPDFAFPGGESVGHFLGRVRCAADRLANEQARTVLAVTHGGVIRTMICHFLGIDARKYVAFDVPYGALVVIDLYDGHGVLAALERPEVEAVEPRPVGPICNRTCGLFADSMGDPTGSPGSDYKSDLHSEDESGPHPEGGDG